MRRLILALVATIPVWGCSLESSGTSEGVTLDVDTGVDASSTLEAAIDDSTIDTGTGDETSTPPDTFVPDTFSADTFLPDTFVADTFVADTFVADTFVPDTYVPDTYVPDTYVPDTYVPDTFVADTFVPDTFVADTSVADTSDAPTTGFLACEATAPSSVNVNLTTDGTIDWAHWGHGGLASNWNRKSGGTAIVKGGIGGALWWGSYPTQFSWSNGTPAASVTNTNDGIYQQNKDATLLFDVAGDAAAERTLKTWVTWNGGSGSIEARLSDSSAATVTSTIPPSGVSVGSGIKPMLYTCRFRPLTATGRLHIKVTQTTSAGYVSLIAASLR